MAGMKYEVIGWTDTPYGEFKPHGAVTACVDRAVIAEIREHGYCFGGDAHENYMPVLNDGTYAEYSWRGWGAVMAQAYGGDAQNYMNYYMNEFIKPSARKYPRRDVDTSRIRLKEELAETFTMHVADDMFCKIKAGTKTIELRLFDEKRKAVDIGDFIVFENSRGERVKKKVADLYVANTFKELITKSEYAGSSRAEVFRYPPVSLGMDENSSPQSATQFMRRFYGEEEEQKYGTIAFILENVQGD